MSRALLFSAVLLASPALTGCIDSINRFRVDAGSCPDGKLLCGGECFVARTDDRHCGACNNACSADKGCGGGQCIDRNCPTHNCGGNHVCVAGACVQKSCVGITCLGNETCFDGACVPRDCRTFVCPDGQACVDNACVDPSCVGVTCGANQACVLGRCASTLTPTSTFSSGGSVGESGMSNGTHSNWGVLGESTPPTGGQVQSNGRMQNQGGFVPAFKTQ